MPAKPRTTRTRPPKPTPQELAHARLVNTIRLGTLQRIYPGTTQQLANTLINTNPQAAAKDLDRIEAAIAGAIQAKPTTPTQETKT